MRFYLGSHGIIQQCFGDQFNISDSVWEPYRIFASLSNSHISRFIYPCEILRVFRSKLDDKFTNDFSICGGIIDTEEYLSWPQNLRNLLQRQLWRLQDLRNGGRLRFTVELFLVALNQLFTASPPQDSYPALYIGTFRVITSDWGEYKHSLGTQKTLLDAVASNQGIVHRFNYPTYITDELLSFLGRFLEGQTGPHIENAVQQLSLPDNRPGMEFRAKALRVISRFQAPSSF